MSCVQIDDQVLLDEGDGGVVADQRESEEKALDERKREDKDYETCTIFHLSLTGR